MNARMLVLHDAAKGIGNVLRREAFVTSAVDTDGGVAADALHIVLGIGDEHIGIVWVGAVGRVGQPEVLPYHDAMAVAGFVQLFVANLSYPVTHHGEVHVGMMGYGYVVFASAVVEVVFAESPVTTTSDEASAVDKEAQDAVVFVEVHLADTYLEIFCIRHFPIDAEGEVGIVQIRFAISFRPPQAKVLILELSEFAWVETDGLFFVGSQFYRLFEADVAYLAAQSTFDSCLFVVLDDDFGGQSGGCVRQCQSGLHERVLDGHLAGCSEVNIVVDADVASADG